MNVSWKIAILTAICGFCCGILFMLLPAVTAYFKRVLKIGQQPEGRTESRTWNTRSAQPTAVQVLEARQLLRQKGYIIRERRSL